MQRNFIGQLSLIYKAYITPCLRIIRS